MLDQPKTSADAGGWWQVWRRWWRLGARREGGVAGLAEERRALEAAMVRKRRNDRVRHQELEELRELMRARQVAVAADARTEPVVPPSTSGRARSGWPRAGADKSRTMEQIARIEAQMAQHWMPRASEAPGLRVGAPVDARGGPIVSGHWQARAGAPRMSIDLVAPETTAAEAALEAWLAHPLLTEAAVRFANGRLDEARRALEALQAQEVRSPLARVAGRMLLDLLWAAGDVEGFDEWAAEWADRFGQPVPRWPAVLPPAAAATPDSTPAKPTPTGAPVAWVCPPLLDAAAVEAMAQRVNEADGVVWLDWTDLLSADAEAAERLATVMAQWAQRPLVMRWRGCAVLRRRLKASTPSGRRENHPAWWRLRLVALQLMGRRDEFDLVALDWCMTCGELPPPWREPVARVEATDAWPELPPAPAPPAPAQPTASLDEAAAWPELATSALPAPESEFPAVPTVQVSGWSVQTHGPGAAPVLRLEGVLLGDIAAVLAAWDAALGDADANPAGPPSGAPVGNASPPVEPAAAQRRLVVDARRLQRVDFAAAGALLQWLLAARGRGVQVEIDGVSPLLAVLFHVVGIDEVATVRLRQ